MGSNFIVIWLLCMKVIMPYYNVFKPEFGMKILR